MSALAAQAQSWPAKPIRIIAPIPPGGTADQLARRAAPGVQKHLNVPVMVENKPGATASIGTQAAANAPPDGYTWVVVFDAHAINPSLIPNLPFDTQKDLAPVMIIAKAPNLITALATGPYTSFADLSTAVKATPARIAYGTTGSGTLAHLAMISLLSDMGLAMTHVPYKGGGPLVNDATAGHVPTSIASIALLSPHVASGKLRPLAVTSAKRSPLLPDVPTVAELGLPGFAAETWWGLLGPARTPPEIIARMHEAMTASLGEPATRKALGEQGFDLQLSSPEAFGALIASEIPRWAKVVADHKISAGE